MITKRGTVKKKIKNREEFKSKSRPNFMNSQHNEFNFIPISLVEILVPMQKIQFSDIC